MFITTTWPESLNVNMTLNFLYSFSWNVIDVTIDEARGHNSTASEDQDILTDICKLNQPRFKLIPMLTPFTRYAAYVKTYTTQQDRNGAQSPIIYLTTLPGRKCKTINEINYTLFFIRLFLSMF